MHNNKHPCLPHPVYFPYIQTDAAFRAESFPMVLFPGTGRDRFKAIQTHGLSIKKSTFAFLGRKSATFNPKTIRDELLSFKKYLLLYGLS